MLERAVLHVVAWNCCGLRSSAIDGFLETLAEEMPWGVAFLQEFSAAKYRGETFRTSAGHVVYCSTPTVRCETVALVIHACLPHLYLLDSLRRLSRCVAIAIHWQGWNLN